MKPAVVLAALVALTACQPDPFGRSNAELREEERICTAEGGIFRAGGITGAKMCFLQTGDGDQSCRRSTECESACLASPDTGKGQCASERPLFGCFDMFDENGELTGICVD